MTYPPPHPIVTLCNAWAYTHPPPLALRNTWMTPHMPIPLQPPFLDFLCNFSHFRCSRYYFVSYLIQLRNSAHMSTNWYLYIMDDFPTPMPYWNWISFNFKCHLLAPFTSIRSNFDNGQNLILCSLKRCCKKCLLKISPCKPNPKT